MFSLNTSSFDPLTLPTHEKEKTFSPETDMLDKVEREIEMSFSAFKSGCLFFAVVDSLRSYQSRMHCRARVGSQRTSAAAGIVFRIFTESDN